jgi:maleylpyruvate isomerase
VTADPLLLVVEVDRATARLLETARRLDERALAGPSLLPGWTRGHVLAHVARNADGCVNLLTWARTGVETPQYASAAQRAADVAAGAGRPIAAQLADISASAERFLDAVAQMPAAAWAVEVRWLSGTTGPAAGVVWSRLREVEVHHVDLDAGYGPTAWSEAFCHRLLHELAAGFGAAPDGPRVRLRATDLGHEVTIGGDDDVPTVHGSGAALAAWLTGRSAGADLTVTPDGPLPPVPTWK